MQRPGWQKMASEQIFTHPRIPIMEDTVRLRGGAETPYAIFTLPDAVTVVIRQDNKYLLNLEYTYPVDDRIHRPHDITCDGWLYKFPGGMLKDGEGFEAAALREVEEETGHKIGNVTLLAAVRNYFPRSNSRDYKVLAEITSSGTVKRDAEETDMEQHWLTRAEIDALITARDPRVMFSHFLDTWHLASLYN